MRAVSSSGRNAFVLLRSAAGASTGSASSSGRNTLTLFFLSGAVGGATDSAAGVTAASGWSLTWRTASFSWLKVSSQPSNGHANRLSGSSSMRRIVTWTVKFVLSR